MSVVAHKGEACLHTRPLAIEPRIGIRGRGMCFVGTLLAPEVHFGVCGHHRLAVDGSDHSRRSWLPFGLTLFIDAQASMSVPSTLK